jgi:hypothetical protein
MVDAAGRVHFGFVLAWHVRRLHTSEDVEVVVSRMATRVTLGANGSA